MPKRVRERGKLRRYASRLFERRRPIVLMPLEQEVYQTVLLQSVVLRLLDGGQETL